MNTTSFRARRFAAYSLAVLGLLTLNTGLLAQPVVTYTVFGNPGNFTLDFKVNNKTPGSQGFDIYMLTLQADGGISGTPSGYYTSRYDNPHFWELGNSPTQYGPFNSLWIDPTYTVLPTGSILSGFLVNITDATPPAFVPYYAWGTENNGQAYTGPGNLNLGNRSNPFFLGVAVQAVPEPATISLIAVASLLLLPLCRGRVNKVNNRVR